MSVRLSIEVRQGWGGEQRMNLGEKKSPLVRNSTCVGGNINKGLTGWEVGARSWKAFYAIFRSLNFISHPVFGKPLKNFKQGLI